MTKLRRRRPVGTGELSHNCGGSFANTEMFTMCSAQLQSIKNAVNTYKVSFAIFASNTMVEAQPPWPVGSSSWQSHLGGGSNAALPTLQMSPPRVCQIVSTMPSLKSTLGLQKVLDLRGCKFEPCAGFRDQFKIKIKKRCKPCELGGDGRERTKRSNSKLCILLYYEDNKISRLCSEKFLKIRKKNP